MGGSISQPVVVEDLDQLRLFQRPKRLPRLIVIHQDHLQPRRVEHIPLVADAQVHLILIHHQKIVVFFAQNPV